MGTAYRLPGVRLFASGIYRGQPWPASRVQTIAGNVRRNADLITPPAVLGHEEDQDWLDRTDLEAAGWVDPKTVQATPDPDHPGELILTGDVVNVPAPVARLIEQGHYGYGSAEFYDLADDFGKPRGMTLRRFGLLGGEVPQVKRLGRLPRPVPMEALRVFGERQTAPPPAAKTFILRFGERHIMDRQAMTAAVMAAMPSMSQAFLDALSDDQLKELVAALPTPAASPAADPAAPPAAMADGDPAADPAMTPAPMSRDEMIAALVGMGQDQAQLDAMDDAALKSLYDEMTAAAPTDAAAPPATMGEKAVPPAVVAYAKFAEQQHKRLMRQATELKAQKVAAFCDRLVREGRILPVQRPDYLSLLGRLDDTHSAHKFGENGRTVLLTALDRKMRDLAARSPVVRFGDKVPGGIPEQATKEQAMAKARQHAESVPESAWGQTGFRTGAGFVAKFGEMYDKNPTAALTMLS